MTIEVVRVTQYPGWDGRETVRLDLVTDPGTGEQRNAFLYVVSDHPLARLRVGDQRTLT